MKIFHSYYMTTLVLVLVIVVATLTTTTSSLSIGNYRLPKGLATKTLTERQDRTQLWFHHGSHRERDTPSWLRRYQQRRQQQWRRRALFVRGGGSGGGTATTPSLPSPSSPPTSTWIFPALTCATAYALYNLFIKKASSTQTPIDPLLGGVILQLVAATMGAGLYVWKNLIMASSSSSSAAAAAAAASTKIWSSGVGWSVAAGVAVGAAEILSFIISGMGVKASQSIPTIVGGSVVVGTVLGAVWLKEKLTLTGWLGVVLIAIGIAIVGMDPGTVGHP